ADRGNPPLHGRPPLPLAAARRLPALPCQPRASAHGPAVLRLWAGGNGLRRLLPGGQASHVGRAAVDGPLPVRSGPLGHVPPRSAVRRTGTEVFPAGSGSRRPASQRPALGEDVS